MPRQQHVCHLCTAQQRNSLPADQRPHSTPHHTTPHHSTPRRAGPLFRRGASRGHDVQFGILAFGDSTVLPVGARTPGSYTSVGVYYDWIQVRG